jgi:hypothetical protein
MYYVDAEDYDKLEKKLGHRPSWKEIRQSDCRVYLKDRQTMAQGLIELARFWSAVPGVEGKAAVWTEAADAVIVQLVLEISQGFYEGMYLQQRGKASHML